jgi:hypothetical protein
MMKTPRHARRAALATLIVIASALMAWPPRQAFGLGDGGPATQQVIREGEVVEITPTTVTVREWAGRYTYRLTPTGRQSLEAAGIRVGDRVQLHAYSIWEIAYYFRKL